MFLIKKNMSKSMNCVSPVQVDVVAQLPYEQSQGDIVALIRSELFIFYSLLTHSQQSHALLKEECWFPWTLISTSWYIKYNSVQNLIISHLTSCTRNSWCEHLLTGLGPQLKTISPSGHKYIYTLDIGYMLDLNIFILLTR